MGRSAPAGCAIHVEFVNSAVARFFPAPMPPPVREESLVEEVEEVQEVAAAAPPVEATPEERVAADTASPDAAVVAAQAKLQAEEKLEQPAPVQVAKVEKPKKVDDRKLKKAAAEYRKRCRPTRSSSSVRSGRSGHSPVGEPIIEPLYSLPN